MKKYAKKHNRNFHLAISERRNHYIFGEVTNDNGIFLVVQLFKIDRESSYFLQYEPRKPQQQDIPLLQIKWIFNQSTKPFIFLRFLNGIFDENPFLKKSRFNFPSK